MASLHEALKMLGVTEYSEVPVDNLKPFLTQAFTSGQLLVDSVPISVPPESITSLDGRTRSSAGGSSASSASEILQSPVRALPPPPEVEVLQKEWKPVKVNQKDNPLGMSVYKCSSKDGKGAWFARRSVHEGLGFAKWKKALEREFPETMKVQGGPGEGNIRGIGGEMRVEYKNIDGVGKMEVYLLSAQFPRPTTPRDFVTMFLTSDQALKDQSDGRQEIPRHFMVISKPCLHPDTTPREGFIRGQYESVEFIREIIPPKKPQRSASAFDLSTMQAHNSSNSSLGEEAILRNAAFTQSPKLDDDAGDVERHSTGTASDQNLSKSPARARGKTISFDISRDYKADEEGMDPPKNDPNEEYPVEWIMITRSDPGGSVPRFMVERGTPGGIVADASKFLDWACSKDIEEFHSDDESLAEDQDGKDLKQTDQVQAQKQHDKNLDNVQTNGHLAGISGSSDTIVHHIPEITGSSGLYNMVVSAASAAGTRIAAHTPTLVSDRFPSSPSYAHPDRTDTGSTVRRSSASSTESASSVGSFTSALEGYETKNQNDASSAKTTDSGSKTMTPHEKELQKLEVRKRKLHKKLTKAREKELSKKSDDTEKEAEAIRKVEEKHYREVKRQEERHKKEVEKLEQKKEKEAKRLEERKRKAAEKDEKNKLMRELDEVRAEMGVLRKEKEILRSQVGDLQAENTALAARVGRMGLQGEEVLRDVREEVKKGGRLRATSLRSTVGRSSNKSSTTDLSVEGKA